MNITVTAAPLPQNWNGTPQQFLEALIDRLELSVDGSSFVISDTQPQGNQGPWLKDGTQWWVWDVDTSTYIPQDLSASVTDEIYIGDVANGPPDSATYSLWLQTSGSKLNGLYWFAGGTAGWVTQPKELVNGAVALAMLAPQAAGAIITFDENQNPILLNPGSAGTFLQSTGSGLQWASLFTVHGTPTFITPVVIASGTSNTGANTVWVTVDGLETHGVPTTATALILQVSGSTYNQTGGQINERPTGSGIATPGYMMLWLGTSQNSSDTAGVQVIVPFALISGSISIDYQVVGLNNPGYTITLIGYIT
jgi:hypothetical protein